MTITLDDGSTVHAVTPPQVTVTSTVEPAPNVATPTTQPAGTVTGVTVYMPSTTGDTSTTTYPFPTPAATWTVTHRLGRNPLVQLIDATGQQVDGDVEYPDLNTVVVTHAQPLAGSVLLI